jgi:hypothetical protein
MLLSESFKNRLKKLAGILTEEVDNETAFALSNNRVPFSIDLMTQAIQEGREVGILYKGDSMIAGSGKYRIIYPVAMGTSKKGNKVVRAIHKQGQSEKQAKATGVRSAEVKNVWRLFKTKNIKGMWFTGNFFQGPLNGYNSNDKGMTTVEVYTDLNKIKTFQEDLLKRQQEAGEQKNIVKLFKDKNERPLEQPIENPETRVGGNEKDNNELNV